jgi:O-antigen/teichoic acid export membrane protein
LKKHRSDIIFIFINVFIKLGSFLLTIVYWKYLSLSDFGILSLGIVFNELMLSFFILGIDSTILRYFNEWNLDEKKSKVGFFWSLSIINTIVFMLVLFSFYEYFTLQYFTQNKYHNYFIINLFTLFFNSLSVIPFTLLRLNNQIFKFSIISLISFFLNSLFSLILMVNYDYGVLSIFYSRLFVEIIVSTFWIFYLRNNITPNLNFSENIAELKYGIPNLFNSILASFNSTIDRLLLKNKIDLGSLGLYQLSKNFSSVLTIFAQSLKSNYFPFIYKNSNKIDFKDKILPKFELVYFFTLSIVALSFSLFFMDLIRLVNRPKYYSVAEYIPYFILGYLFHYAESFLGRGSDLNKKTYFDLLFNFGNLLLVSLLSWYLIHNYGIDGAMLSFMIINLMVSLFKIVLSHFVYKRLFLVKEFVFLSIVFFVAFSSIHFLKIQNLYFSVIIKLFISLTYSIIVYVTLFGVNFFINIFSSLLYKTLKLRV